MMYKSIGKTNYYLIGVFLASIAAVIVAFSLRTPPQVDWLNNSQWSSFSGAQETEHGIKISATGRAISHTDTSTSQPNPPVNLRGSHLLVPEDFKISMSIEGVNNGATMQFYGQVPVIYDEWRQERPSIRLNVYDDGVQVQVWHGSASNSIDQRRYDIELADKTNLALEYKDGEITIVADNRILGRLPGHNIFADKTIWFGADATIENDGWLLTKLTAQSLSDEPVQIAYPPDFASTEPNDDSLRSLAQNNDRKLPIGAAVAVGPLLTDEKYRQIVSSQFNMITPENSFKPQYVHPLEDLYLFEDTDLLVEMALENEMIVHGHSLVMGKANPEWMQYIPEDEIQQEMVEHITTIMSRYKGKIAQWDVVNEPMSEDYIDYNDDQKGLRKQMWFDEMGEKYIDIAYKAARAADPDAKLYLNDFGLEKDGDRWVYFLELVQRLQARGVPIDGVGFEAHVYHSPADTIDPDVLREHIQTLASLGLESRISEIDVLGDDAEYQAKQYSEVLEVCLSEPSCKSYGTWGVTDLYGSTTLSDRYPIVLGDSLLWGTDYEPKQAYSALQAVLRSR